MNKKKKRCCYVSNCINADTITDCQGLPRARVSHHYNTHMGSVDRVDRFISVIRHVGKNNTGSKALFIWHLDVALSNSFTLMCLNSGKRLEICQFCELVRNGLIGIGKNHYLSKTNSNGSCQWCRTNSSRKSNTQYQCVDCEVWLHKKCTNAFHRSHKRKRNF